MRPPHPASTLHPATLRSKRIRSETSVSTRGEEQKIEGVSFIHHLFCVIRIPRTATTTLTSKNAQNTAPLFQNWAIAQI